MNETIIVELKEKGNYMPSGFRVGLFTSMLQQEDWKKETKGNWGVNRKLGRWNKGGLE